MRSALLAGIAALTLAAGCGGDDDGRDAATSPTDAFTSGFVTGPQRPSGELEPLYKGDRAPREPAGLPAGTPRVVTQAGCLACHQLGTAGNSGPGNNLTAIGARRTASQIRRSLLAPSAPMPSYRQLPRAQLDTLVDYLAGLRDRDCPGTSDCG